MICTSFSPRSLGEGQALARSCALVEYRLEHWADPLSRLPRLIAGGPPAIITCRTSTDCPPQRALEVLGAALEGGPAFLDLDHREPEPLGSLLLPRLAKGGVRLIRSHHDAGVPGCLTLMDLYQTLARPPADLVKLVVSATNPLAALSCLDLYRDPAPRPVPLICFAMGEAGTFTRPLSVLLGAPFLYARHPHSEATAPGQTDTHAMTLLLNTLRISGESA